MKSEQGCSISSKTTLAEHSCLTLFSDNRVGHSFVTLLWHTLVGHSCGTLLWDLHTSQNITFSHFPHRQRGNVIRDRDTKTIRKQSTTPRPQERKQEPFATHSGKTICYKFVYIGGKCECEWLTSGFRLHEPQVMKLTTLPWKLL